jgi:dTDP-4-dehydrorhamnose reductase
MTCSGSVSWCGFARAIVTRTQALLDGKMPVINPISSAEYPTPAKRPQNSCLSNEMLHPRFTVRLAPWDTALDVPVRRLALPQQQP